MRDHSRGWKRLCFIVDTYNYSFYTTLSIKGFKKLQSNFLFHPRVNLTSEQSIFSQSWLWRWNLFTNIIFISYSSQRKFITKILDNLSIAFEWQMNFSCAYSDYLLNLNNCNKFTATLWRCHTLQLPFLFTILLSFGKCRGIGVREILIKITYDLFVWRFHAIGNIGKFIYAISMNL